MLFKKDAPKGKVVVPGEEVAVAKPIKLIVPGEPEVTPVKEEAPAKKPKKLKKVKKEEVIEAIPTDESPKETPKPKAPKSTKVESEKAIPSRDIENSFLVRLSYDEMFPKKINTALGKMTRIDLEGFEEVQERIENTKNLADFFIATYWNAERVKSFKYKDLYYLAKRPAPFELDLDFSNVLAVGADSHQVVAMSAITEAVCVFLEEDFDVVSVTSPSGESTDSMRLCNGMPFAFYEVQ